MKKLLFVKLTKRRLERGISSSAPTPAPAFHKVTAAPIAGTKNVIMTQCGGTTRGSISTIWHDRQPKTPAQNRRVYDDL